MMKTDYKRYYRLTPKQTEVLQLLADGLTRQEVCDKLYLEISTVRCHINAASRALGAHSLLEAVLKALRKGHITLNSWP